MVNSFVARKDLDAEMTVVRNEFEMGENNAGARAVPAHAAARLRLAQLRQRDHRPARRHRAGADRRTCRRSTAPGTSPTTLCSSSRGKFDEKKALELVAKHFGADSEAQAQAAELLHRGADAGRRARRDAAARGRRTRSCRRSTACRRAATPTIPPSTSSPTCWATCPPDACTARWSRRASRATPGARSAACTIRASCTSAPRCRRTASSTRRARRCSRRSRA